MEFVQQVVYSVQLGLPFTCVTKPLRTVQGTRKGPEATSIMIDHFAHLCLWFLQLV